MTTEATLSTMGLSDELQDEYPEYSVPDGIRSGSSDAYGISGAKLADPGGA